MSNQTNLLQRMAAQVSDGLLDVCGEVISVMEFICERLLWVVSWNIGLDARELALAVVLSAIKL